MKLLHVVMSVEEEEARGELLRQLRVLSAKLPGVGMHTYSPDLQHFEVVLICRSF